MPQSGSSIAGEPPVAAPPPDHYSEPPAGGWRKYALAAGFLAPAAFLLLIWVVYPAISTIYRSFFDKSGDEFVWFDNYTALFTNDRTLTAIKNNFLWLLIVPAFVTAIGLIFAVLTERVRWAVAFKTVVFMPMAISAFAAAVIWRVMDQKDPDIGAVNAMIRVGYDYVNPPGVLADAKPATADLAPTPDGGLELKGTVPTGTVALHGPDRDQLRPKSPQDAVQAVSPSRSRAASTASSGETSAPAAAPPARSSRTSSASPASPWSCSTRTATRSRARSTADDGTFEFAELEQGQYRVAIGADTFAEPFLGISWLGEKLITPSIMFAYVWIWAGFAMVVIAAGLASISRETLEAARTDGATEWQVFKRVTVPQLWPVLSVVFITMLINVLKVFDIVIALAPGSVQDDANVIALDMWRTSFGGISDFGYGSAIAVFLFLLVIPILLLNVRRFRREV